MTPGRKIKCAGPPAGPTCDAYLGEIVGGKVRIYCARCKSHHTLLVDDLVQETIDWFRAAQPALRNQFLERLAEEQKANGGGEKKRRGD